MTTGAARPQQPAIAEQGDIKGWSRAGGTQVTVKSGETVYNLSRRFGVPADVIMKSNGLSEADGLKAGSKIVIPTYVYSRKAPVSAPDSDPNVADAKSSRGTRYDVPANKTPVPHRAPVERTAVLPDAPKVREVETASASSGCRGKSSGSGGVVPSRKPVTISTRRSGVIAVARHNTVLNGMG